MLCSIAFVALIANVRLGLNANDNNKRTSLLKYGIFYDCKSFIVQAAGPNVVKLVIAVIY